MLRIYTDFLFYLIFFFNPRESVSSVFIRVLFLIPLLIRENPSHLCSSVFYPSVFYPSVFYPSHSLPCCATFPTSSRTLSRPTRKPSRSFFSLLSLGSVSETAWATR